MVCKKQAYCSFCYNEQELLASYATYFIYLIGCYVLKVHEAVTVMSTFLQSWKCFLMKKAVIKLTLSCSCAKLLGMTHSSTLTTQPYCLTFNIIVRVCIVFFFRSTSALLFERTLYDLPCSYVSTKALVHLVICISRHPFLFEVRRRPTHHSL